jgi:chaperonin cofactor prefoldin
LQALNERDNAIKADNERRFDVLNQRIEVLEREHRSVEQKVDELLALSHQRMYRGH